MIKIFINRNNERNILKVFYINNINNNRLIIKIILKIQVNL